MNEFQEIAHCGGKFTVTVKTEVTGTRSVQFGIIHSRPTPASIVGVYTLPLGIPVGMMQLGGYGQSSDQQKFSGCFPVFVASDSHGKFGQECPECTNYWRSDGPSVFWPTTCPYCGFRSEGHKFFTLGQKKYIISCCELIERAISSSNDGETSIDMDQVADAAGKDCKRPSFFYAEQSQQKRFNCTACGMFNDILGRYGYCSSCGTHNGIVELESEINKIRKKIPLGEFENCVKEAVAAFDSYARQLAKQLANRIPMTPARKEELERKMFHNLKKCGEDLNSIFGISLFQGIQAEDTAFAIRMFYRRHVYEHNGGEVDEKYIQDSGDNSVKPKQTITESAASAARTADIILKIGRNLHKGFHLIFPPEEKPISLNQRRTPAEKMDR